MTVSKFYIRYRDDMPETEMQAVALYGFRARGVETAPFRDFEQIRQLRDLGTEVGLAGYVADVWEAVAAIGAPRPPTLDYPDELAGFLGRRLRRTNVKTARELTGQRLFIKPVEHKLFGGFVTTGTFDDQLRLGSYSENEELWLGDVVDFVSEYRCFVLRGEVIAVHWYRGDWSVAIRRSVVEAAVEAYGSAPVAYTLDFGATRDGRTLLVEVNDGYAMGTYGLRAELYAAMLEARWEELTAGPG